MGAVKKTSLSAGAVIRAILLEDPEVSGKVSKIFPVATDKAELPYILYRRASLTPTSQKGIPVPEEIALEVYCYTSRYAEGVELAEAVRQALDGQQAVYNGQRMRSCVLTDSSEDWTDDAYVQLLVFTIRI